MNILLSALVITLILLPGFVFRQGYLSDSSRKYYRLPFSEEFSYSIYPALIIHFFGYIIVESFIIGVDEKKFYNLLINAKEFDPVSKDIKLFFIYILISSFIALGIGYVFRKISLKYDLHLKQDILRIFSDWQEYLDGYALNKDNIPGEKRDVAHTWLDILVETDGKAHLYSGILKSYSLTKEGKLDKVFLTAVRRRSLDNDLKKENLINHDSPNTEYSEEQLISQFEEKSDYYYMPGDYFVIPGENILNINIIYFKEEEG